MKARLIAFVSNPNSAFGWSVAGVSPSEASVGQPAHTPSDVCQRASVAGAQQEAGDGRQQQEDGPALLEAECWVHACTSNFLWMSTPVTASRTCVLVKFKHVSLAL